MTKTLTLKNGEVRELDLAALAAAARNLPEASPGVRAAYVDDRLVELLPLFESALEVDQGSISVHEALLAANKVGLRLRATRSGSSEPVRTPEALKAQLFRHRGQWVAVRDNAITAARAELNELLETVSDLEVTVLFVPDDERRW